MITPAQALEIARRLFEVIDHAIKTAATDGKWPVSIHLPPNDSRAVVDLVIDEYRKAGWEMRLVIDFRDGDYIRIEAP